MALSYSSWESLAFCSFIAASGFTSTYTNLYRLVLFASCRARSHQASVRWLSLVTVMIGSSSESLLESPFILCSSRLNLVWYPHLHSNVISPHLPLQILPHVLFKIVSRSHNYLTPGVAIVGLSGSMVKDAVKETATIIFNTITSPSSLGTRSADMPSPESAAAPQASKVLVGVFFILFAQILSVKR